MKHPLAYKSCTYLGDGVYITIDEMGYSVITTGHHEPALADNQIYLEPGMIEHMKEWLDKGAPDWTTGRCAMELRPDPRPPD